MLRWLLVALGALSLLLFFPLNAFFQSEVALYGGTEGHPWWNDAVFYEVFVRSFHDSDGDGQGDLQGLIQRLDYLNDGDPRTDDDLGVTGIWLMPVMPAASYHGYDVSDYLNIHPDYGTLDDFRTLVREAHRRGIRVILDLVLNHTSVAHPWFQAALADPAGPYRDYYLWREEDPGYASPLGGSAWHPSTAGYYYAAFWGAMPDLNLENPAVVDELRRVTRFWLEEMGVDGFRLDAIKHLVEEGRVQSNTPSTHAWLRDFHDFYRGVSRRAVTVGEVWSPTRDVAPYVGREVDLAFDFDVAETLVAAARDANAGPLRIAHAVAAKAYPPNQFATFLSNHDQDRVMSELNGDWSKAKVAASLLLTGPGVPFIYNGEEIGMLGVKPDEDIRSPMQWEDGPGLGFSTGEPWRAPSFEVGPRAVGAQRDDPDSLLSHYRRLIRLRLAQPALRVGAYHKVISTHRSVYAFLRRSAEQTLLVVANLSDGPIQDYALSFLEPGVLAPLAGPLAGAREWVGEEAVAVPQVTAERGFADYRPLDELAPRALLVIELDV